MVVVTVETDCHLAPEMVVCNRSDGLPPVPRTPSQQGRWIWDGMDGQTPETSNMPQQQPQQQQANVSQNVQGFAESTTNLDGKWSRVSGAGMSTRKHARNNARTRTSMVWCAMDSPTTNVYATEFASVCTKFWLLRVCLVDPRSGSFPNLGVNPMSCQGNMPSGPVGASLGGFDASGGADPRGHGMLGSMSEGQLQTVQQHMQEIVL